MNLKIPILVCSAIFSLSLALNAQVHLYIGRGTGRYQFHQGLLETRAWVFNNYTGVKKEMRPDQNFGGLVLGSSINAGRVVFGMEYCGKNNRFSGEREAGGAKITDRFNEKLNTFYINFGIGNKIDYSKTKIDAESKKIVWRIQTAFGFYNFKLKEELKGSDEFNGILGNRKGVSCRMAGTVLFKLSKKVYLNIVPFYEFDTGGGFVEILEDRIKNSELFNITNYGININLDYAF